jgi:hypothetical protein
MAFGKNDLDFSALAASQVGKLLRIQSHQPAGDQRRR